MANRTTQAYDPQRGYRWLCRYDGQRDRIVWAWLKAEALEIAETKWGEPIKIEQAPADWRMNRRAIDGRRKRLNIRVTAGELARIHEAADRAGVQMTRFVVDRALGRRSRRSRLRRQQANRRKAKSRNR